MLNASNAAPEIPAPAGVGHNQPTPTAILRDKFQDLMNEVETLANEATEEKNKLQDGKIANDNQRDPFVSIGVAAGKLVKRLEALRLETTKPLRDEVDETNAFFKTLFNRANRIHAAFETLVGDFDTAQREAAKRVAAQAAEEAAAEARRKLDEAAASKHSMEGDVILQEAERAEHRAQHFASQALDAGTGPTRTASGTISQRTNWDFRITNAAKIDLNALRACFGIADIEKAIRLYVRNNRDTIPLAGVEIYPSTKTQLRA